MRTRTERRKRIRSKGPPGGAKLIATLAILGIASYLLSSLIAPADPISEYLCTLALWLLASASYAIGIYHGRRQVAWTKSGTTADSTDERGSI